jgi:hypothetical protein
LQYCEHRLPIVAIASISPIFLSRQLFLLLEGLVAAKMLKIVSMPPELQRLECCLGVTEDMSSAVERRAESQLIFAHIPEVAKIACLAHCIPSLLSIWIVECNDMNWLSSGAWVVH